MEPYRITLDLKRNYYQVLVMKAGDVNSREIIITITDNGKLYDISHHTVRLKWHKPDHHIAFNDCLPVNEDKHSVTIKCTEQMLITEGIAEAEVLLCDESDQTVLSTMKFSISIEASVIDNKDIESSDEFGALNHLLLTNKEIGESLKSLEEEVSGQEEIRQANENTRINNEDDRVKAEEIRISDTADAITNANSATANATNATKHADNAADAADTAALNANSATREANTTIQKMKSLMRDDNLIHRDDLGVAGGVATLDNNGKVPSYQLPSYVDDVLEGRAVNTSLNTEGNAMSATGFILTNESQECIPESGKIYLDTDTNLQYRWTGSVYISTGSVLELGETSATAFPGDRGLSLEGRISDIEAYHNNIPASDIKFDNRNTFLLGANVQDALTELTQTATQTKSGLLSSEDKKRIDNYADIQKISITLYASNWTGSSAPYTQLVTVPDLSLYNYGCVVVSDTATVNQNNAAADAQITSISYGESTGLTFTAIGKRPAIDIPITLCIGTSMNVVEIPNYLGETPVIGVKGAKEAAYRNGEVNLTPEDIGLGNVNNTSDADKPISDATQNALNAIQAEMAAVKKSVSDGKTTVASAITNQGVQTAADATFQTMAENINSAGTNKYNSGYSAGSSAGYNSGVAATKKGTAAPAQVLTGYTFTSSSGVDLSGSMTNHGAVGAVLNCSGSYSIPAGYHNGSGKVTANSLAAQTSATASAAQILNGSTAWANGNKITGTITNRGAVTKTFTPSGSSQSYTIPAGYHNGSGKVTCNAAKIVKNTNTMSVMLYKYSTSGSDNAFSTSLTNFQDMYSNIIITPGATGATVVFTKTSDNTTVTKKITAATTYSIASYSKVVIRNTNDGGATVKIQFTN